MSKEVLLEELEAVKHCITMTKDNISHDKTQQEIIAVLDNRITQLQEEVDAKIDSEELGGDMSMDVSQEVYMKYQGEEIGSNKCGITQICVAMAMLAGSFLTLIVIGLVMNFLPV